MGAPLWVTVVSILAAVASIFFLRWFEEKAGSMPAWLNGAITILAVLLTMAVIVLIALRTD